jgi:outer membrane receptor for ferrienterochelin and colicin
MRRSFLLFLLLFVSSLTFAQQGSLVGKVLDKKTGEAVIGATVVVTGTTQAAPVDVEGNYELKLAAGTYGITITNIGYKALTFTGIVIKPGQKTTLNGTLEENVIDIQGVTVTGQRQTGTEIALIQDLRKSEVVVSGMSNDQIVKTLDRDAAEVVKRIPGVTVQNNNFIVIRGLAERYNTVLLNDALTPSAEVDTRSFSFDILPSSVIDRVLIYKSGSPELPGEFGGGVVKVYTKNSVLENSTSLSVSGWARSTNTFRGGYMSTDRSKTDFLGFDSGQRDMPGSLAGVSTQGATAEQLQQIRSEGSLRNEWLPQLSRSRPDLRLSLGINRRYEIGKVYLSNVTSLSYSSTQEQYESRRQRFRSSYDPATDLKEAYFYDYNDTRAVTGVRLGIIHNWQARLNDRNRLEFRNFFNQYGTDEVLHRTGVGYEANSDGIDRDKYALHYQSRSIYSGQLGGTHEVGANANTTLTWAAGYNYVKRNEPDYRQFQSERDRPTTYEPELKPYKIVINQDLGNSSRYFSDLTENTYMASGQWERRFSGRDTLSANQYKLRVGFYTEQKKRTFESRYFNYVRGRRFADSLRLQSPEVLFNNLDPINGLTIKESTTSLDRYDAENTLVAGYVGAVAPISDKFNVSGGVRVEYNRKYSWSGDPNFPAYEEKRTLVLPSVNAAYNFSERSLLRLAGSVSANRPEFREVAEYSYYDVANNYFIQGDAKLQTATIYGGDLRYEFYPTKAEMVSVGLFYKHFDKAIEQVTKSTSGSDLTLTYQNAKSAYDVGVEVEARKSMVGLTDNPILQRFNFVLNASFIRSRVQLDTTLADNKGFALTDRALQGQSPYVVNFGTFYQDDEHKWQVSAQYNVIGPRITFVGDKAQNFSVIELPRHVVDLAVTKGIGSHLEIRAGIQNLLNQYVQQRYDLNRNGKIEDRETGVFARYRRGQYSTLGLTYRF